MNEQKTTYRVLDLTHGECLLGGRIMGDLGADVIQVEKPGDHLSRNRGPFYNRIIASDIGKATR